MHTTSPHHTRGAFTKPPVDHIFDVKYLLYKTSISKVSKDYHSQKLFKFRMRGFCRAKDSAVQLKSGSRTCRYEVSQSIMVASPWSSVIHLQTETVKRIELCSNEFGVHWQEALESRSSSWGSCCMLATVSTCDCLGSEAMNSSSLFRILCPTPTEKMFTFASRSFVTGSTNEASPPLLRPSVMTKRICKNLSRMSTCTSEAGVLAKGPLPKKFDVWEKEIDLRPNPAGDQSVKVALRKFVWGEGFHSWK